MHVAYTVLFTKQAAGFVSNLTKANKGRLESIVKALRINPFSYPYRKIKGETNLYRIRLGKHRLLFEVDESGGQWLQATKS